MIDEKIIKCELEYTKCFSEFYEDENIVRFRDNQLKDMYHHNYTYVKEAKGENKLTGIIEDEISLRIEEGSNFCNIFLNPGIKSWVLTELKHKPSVSVSGYYTFDITYFSKIKTRPDCSIKRVDSQKMIDEVLYCDLQHDEGNLGRDFCVRRCYRRGRIYVSDKALNSYVLYHNGERIGTCDLFIHEGVAKIEDFGIIPKHQRKGYGTTLLKALIDIALKENCHTIYLVTNEGDTAKDMYLKNGFNKIDERTELFFKL